MKKFLFFWSLVFSLLAAAWAVDAFAAQYQQVVPKDLNNVPIYGGLGLPFYETETVTSDSYDNSVAVSVPLTGVNLGRSYRSIYAYDPSGTRTVFVCIGKAGEASSCTDMMRLEPGYGLILDDVLYGYGNSTDTIFLRLDAAGTVDVRIGGW